jgi:hypothetical protein
MENLEIKSLINPTKTSMGSITNRIDHTKERISGIEDRLENYYIQVALKKKKSNHDHDIQDQLGYD